MGLQTRISFERLRCARYLGRDGVSDLDASGRNDNLPEEWWTRMEG